MTELDYTTTKYANVEYLNETQAAQYLGMVRTTLRYRRKPRYIPANQRAFPLCRTYKIPGSCKIWYKLADLKLLKAKKVQEA